MATVGMRVSDRKFVELEHINRTRQTCMLSNLEIL